MSLRWSPFVKAVVVVALLVLGAWLLNRFHALLAPLVTTLLVTYLLNLPVTWLTRRTGLSRALITALVFLVVVILLVLLPALAGRPVVAQIAALEIDLQALQDALDRFAAQPIEIFSLRLDPQNLLDQLATALGGVMSPVATSALAIVANTAEAIAWLIFVLVIAFYLVKDLHYFGRLIGERIPTPLAPDFYRLGRELGAIWNAFLRGRLVLSVVVGIVAGLALWILGMRSAWTLGVITGVLTFIPSVGPWLAGIPTVLLALVQGSTYLPINNLGFALLVGAIYFAIFQLEAIYLLPRIVGRRIQLHPVAVIAGTIAGALTAGILGVLLAAPVIASARVLLGYLFRKLLDQEPFDEPHETPQALGVQWRGLIRGRPIEAVLFDLDGTLVETDDRMVQRVARRLARLDKILPGASSQRLARRLVMWSDDSISRLLALLDRVGWDRAAQRLARRLQLIEDLAEGQALLPIDGTVPLLISLNGRYRLGIVSTRRTAEIQAYLRQMALEDQISVVVGFDTTERIKPHPQPVLWASEQLGVAIENIAMVGDTAVDVRAAKAAGALAVGVLCGFGERRDLAQADLILESTAELSEWL